MRQRAWCIVGVVLATGLAACNSAGAPPPAAQSLNTIDLAQVPNKLRVVNRRLTTIHQNAVRLSAADGNGLAWVEGTDFTSGTIEVDIRGKDVLQASFVGVAFHRRSDDTYEAVYLRPFNFRATDPVRHQHAVQYIKMPEYDWSDLRETFAEEFENPVDAAIVPTDWVRLRVVVADTNVQIYVGPVKEATLDVRKLGQLHGGQVGLWVGNGSDGDFANLVVRSAP